MSQQTQAASKGFLAALFDFSLTEFVALRFLKIIYIVVTVLVGLATLGVFVAMASYGVAGIVAAVILVPLTGLVYLIVLRVSIEIIAVLFRIGENTASLAAALATGEVPNLGGPGGYAESLAPTPVASVEPVPPAPPVTPTTGYPSVPPPTP